MFEFLMSADLGINPIDIGAAAPTFSSAFSTPLPPMTEPLSEETIARFQAAMEKPLADNAMLQQALESMVVTKERPVVITEKPAVQVPILHTENTEVTEKFVTVVAEAPKASEPSVGFVAKELPVETPVLHTENTKVTEKTTIVVLDKPTVVVPETPKAFENSVNFVAKEIAPEKPVIVVSEKPLAQVEAPILATKNTKDAEKTTIVVSDKPTVVVPETPKTSESSVNYVAKEIAPEKPVMTEEKRPEEVVITAMPNAIPEATVQPIAVPEVKVAPIVSASVEAKVEAVTAAEVLVQAANAVADTMLVSPGLMRGEGEIIVHLKPEVLEATELKISVQSGTMTVEFAPTVEKIATLLTQNQANLVQVLSERVGRYNVVVNVRPSHLKGSRNARA